MQLKTKGSQNGLAAILFIIIFPFMFGVFVLGVEGTRYLQEKARLGDAAEAASLAIAANNADANANKKFALNFVNAYSQDATLTLSDINIVEKTCKQIYGSNCGKPGVYDKDGNQFVEYRVSIDTKYKSWFPSSDYHAGFEEDQLMDASAVARKFRGDTVDVAFVADFSGSMAWWWDGEYKYKGVLRVIENITKELEQFNKLDAVAGSKSSSKVAFVGFSEYTRVGNQYYSNVTYKNKNKNKIDYDKTAKYSSNSIQSKKVNYQWSGNSKFDTIELTNNITSFQKDIKVFIPSGGTASYEGLIAGANVISKGDNRKKLIFILSDGVDSSSSIGRELYTKRNMCQNIRDDLNSKVISGKNVESAIVIIGFDYDIKNSPDLTNCAGGDNVYEATNYDDIFNTILELILEEVGHNYNKDYKVE
ncbi:TadE/TadG family type IV pilus assembly protein [Marinomonas algicola]|uniref:TadE/TadG family type IV pilus assembly protein n=1 Tax=Marinomonas algicola TaxID=2773454 RepID=UPI00174CA23D|nr:pilus assembly protein TadG-related protein [Marinomonas algicola]